MSKQTLADILQSYEMFENTASPAEAFEGIQARHEQPRVLISFFEKLEMMMRQASSEIRPYQRHRLSEHADFYQAGVRKKRLLLCFCGNANRLMIPIPLFLQYIPESLFDVLVLKDPSGLCYHAGVPGLAPDLPGALQQLSALVTLSEYEVTTLGTSGGGCAALYCGAYLNAKQAISVGGRHPQYYGEESSKLYANNLTGNEFEALIANSSLAVKTPVSIVFAEKNAADKEIALAFASKFSQHKLIPVLDTEKHNVFLSLMRSSTLGAFFDSVLLSI